MMKIGHRGAAGYADENTLASFKKAIELKVDAIELDIRKCQTGELVVIHDETVERTTNGKGLVAEKTLNEIKSLETKSSEKIPTLQEALNIIDKQTKVSIHLKEKGLSEQLFKIIEKYVIEQGWQYDNFIIESFSHKELSNFHNLNPNIELVLLLNWTRIIPLKFVKKEKISALGSQFRGISKRFVSNAHEQNLKILTWGANEQKSIDKVKALGVDYIISDYPDLI
jgi:glycerophosphoryl diester phosphodiesterase